MRDLTDVQLFRLYREVWRRVFRAFAGGTMFGIDMPTLRAVAPGWYATVVAIKAEGRSRGLRG